jgi:hypothetical protein
MQVSDNAIDLTIVLIRGATEIIAALGALLSIYLGWRLYRDGVTSPVQGELSQTRKWTAKLSSTGPGVFLAAFGIVLLIYLVSQKAQIETPVALPARATPSVAPASELPGQAGAEARLIRTQTRRAPAARVEQGLVCVVAVRRRVFLGGQGLTPERISSDLAVAHAYLDRANRGQLDVRSASQLADVIDTIDELRDSTGEWALAR